LTIFLKDVASKACGGIGIYYGAFILPM
jgi:hypothetical protein